ncbi:MAG: hypothetical protein ACXACX_20280, partial [Candidatus Hodarchaeales archaeon]
ASDSLSHSLTYTIYYSTTNGASWQEATSGLTATTFLWDVSAFANETMIQVKVHGVDGFGFEASSNINTFEIFRQGVPPSSTPTTTTPGSTSEPDETSTSTPPDSSSKPSDSSNDTLTTTPGLEVIGVLLSLIGILLIRKKKRENF